MIILSLVMLLVDIYIEDNTWTCVDMEYLFQCSTQYLTSAAKGVRYKVEHEKRYSISTSNHLLFCLSYKHTDKDIFDDFLKISDHFPKIFKNLSEGHLKVSQHSLKISKDFLR